MAAKRQNGLIFLDADHAIIRERLTQKLIVEKAEGYEGKLEHVWVTCCDFNNLEMLAQCSKKTNIFHVSVKVPCFDELFEAGAMDVLKARYGDLLLEDPNEPYGKSAKWNVTVAVDINNLPRPAEEIVDLFASLGRNLFAAPFINAFDALNNGKTKDFKPLTLHYRENEQVFVVASPHVIQVIYSLEFDDQVDFELARVSMTEFAEAGRDVDSAPGVNFYPAGRAPDELSDMPHEVGKNCLGYLVFAVSKPHVDKPGKTERVCDLLVQFRSYVLYHIKATKTELHSMMRKTYSSLMNLKERCTPKGKLLKIK